MATPAPWEQILAVGAVHRARHVSGPRCAVRLRPRRIVSGGCAWREPGDLDQLAAAAPPRAPGDPMIESYDDMADLLLLDPVHEVGEQGWPVKPDQAA